ncbi:unnamed protein product, partial [Durusdinium trenchii]
KLFTTSAFQPVAMPLSLEHGASPSRCEVFCPCFSMTVAVALGIIGFVNWEQGFFFSPDESAGGCQGPEFHFRDRERQWRSAWTGSCAFLYRNEPEDLQVFHWKHPRSEEYDSCYRLACKEFCSMHWCLAKTVAAVLWGFTALLVLSALLCCASVGYKMGEQRATNRHRELGKCTSSHSESTGQV